VLTLLSCNSTCPPELEEATAALAVLVVVGHHDLAVKLAHIRMDLPKPHLQFKVCGQRQYIRDDVINEYTSVDSGSLPPATNTGSDVRHIDLEEPAVLSNPVVDASENPFLSGDASEDSGGSVQERLNAVAHPETQRPRAGPHSPSRGHRSGSNSSSTGSSVSSDAESESGGASPSPATKRYDARDVWHFYKPTDSTSTHYSCIFCL
jgi:hypothetical protein